MPPSSSAKSEPFFAHADVAAYSRLLATSFRHWTKQPLSDADDIPYALYHAPFALVSHGVEADPLFRYANLAAQALWGIGWTDFIGMPSRLTAEPVAAAERQRLLEQAARIGYVDDYSGVRITAAGRRFRILKTTLWNVTDGEGRKLGQAAVIRQ